MDYKLFNKVALLSAITAISYFGYVDVQNNNNPNQWRSIATSQVVEGVSPQRVKEVEAEVELIRRMSGDLLKANHEVKEQIKVAKERKDKKLANMILTGSVPEIMKAQKEVNKRIKALQEQLEGNKTFSGISKEVEIINTSVNSRIVDVVELEQLAGPQQVKEEAKEEIKEEVKEEVAEVKEESKEEAKEEIKEEVAEVKEEAKEESKEEVKEDSEQLEEKICQQKSEIEKLKEELDALIQSSKKVLAEIEGDKKNDKKEEQKEEAEEEQEEEAPLSFQQMLTRNMQSFDMFSMIMPQMLAPRPSMDQNFMMMYLLSQQSNRNGFQSTPIFYAPQNTYMFNPSSLSYNQLQAQVQTRGLTNRSISSDELQFEPVFNTTPTQFNIPQNNRGNGLVESFSIQ